jgi:hypothetical protein
MPTSGYTHTCASCEAKLPIHERYVGRTLHCPHCGTEFLADPTLADVDDLMEELAEDRASGGFPWLAVLIVVAAGAVAVWWLGQSEHHGMFSDLFRANPSPGQFAELGIDGEQRVPAAMDHETIVFIVAAIEDDDPGSIEALKVQGRLIEVASGTRVKVIERARRQGAARVRILDGQWTGRVVWVPDLALR